MKDSKKYAKKLDSHLKSLKKGHEKIKVPSYIDPIDAVIFAIIAEHLKASTARTAVKKFQKHFVDHNDLRVSRTEEVLDVLGGKSPHLRAITHTMSEVLNAVYDKFDTVSLAALTEIGKRQARKDLEELESITSFVVSYCFLTALNGHAIPVMEKMVEYLRALALVHPKAKQHDIEGFLERQISVTNAYECYMLIRNAADKFKIPEKKKSEKKSKKPKTTAKKSAKKKAVKKASPKKAKTSKKKTSKKKTTVKKKTVKKKKTAKKKAKKG